MKKAYNLINPKQLLTIFLFVFISWNLAYSQPEKVIINEVNYRSVVILQNIDFIELYNAGSTSVDLTGWQITDAVSYEFPTGTIIAPGDYLVIAGDPNTCESEFDFNNALGPYTGKLSGDGENIELRDQTFCEIHKVEYGSWQEWPAVRFLDEGDEPVSIQKINPDLPGNRAGSWSSDIPTPKAKNTQVYLSNANDIPVIKSVSKTPDSPESGEEVRIKVDMTNIDDLSGTLSIDLEYQIVEPGNYIHKSDDEYVDNWTDIPMLDDGIGADSTPNNGVYTVAIPASIQEHRNLIRYRIKVSTSTGYNNTYPDQNHIESNYAYYVYDDYPLVDNYDINTLDPMQDLTIITGGETADEYIGPGNGYSNSGQYGGSDYKGEGTLVYNDKVYDHIRFRPRGKSGGRGDRYKPALKFDMNAAHIFAPLKSCGNQYDEKRGKLTVSGGYVNDVATHGFTESLIHKILGLMGGMERGTEYTQFRIVDEGNESDDFWGVFMIVEGYDGAYLDEHNHPEGNIWRHKSGRIVHQGDFPNSDDIGDWDKDMDKVDWDIMLGDKAANMFLGNGASNYEGKHSQRDYYNSETGNWHVWYGDYDTTFGMSSDNDTYHDRNDSEYNEGIKLVQDIGGKEEEFKNVMRSAYDLLFNDEQINFLIDIESAKIRNPNAPYDWTDLDKDRWNQNYDLGNIDAQLNWYRGWFEDRSNWLSNDDEDGFDSNGIPDKPDINLTGTTALDDLTFSNSAFSDNGSFEALEWRVGEWSDPSNPVYQDICEPKYEIESVWESGEITSFSNNFTIPGTAPLQAGRTYKIRVRYKDNSDIWSHWSDPVQIIPTPASDNAVPTLVINEIMYNPDEKCSNEFVEIKNTGTNTVALDGFTFTDGIEYNFPKGTTIASGSFIIIAKDSLTFYQKYGFYPFGDYSGSLGNNGERIELRGLYNKIIDSLTYNNKNPWDEMPDGTGHSMELLSTNFDNADASNWFRSDDVCGTPGSENSRVCTAGAAPIVINEINYNSPNSVDAGDWVELHNTTPNSIDLSDWEFYDNDNQFIIPQGTVIQPDDFLILVEDDILFAAAFPHVTDYVSNFDFNLSGGGERISLFDNNKCLSDYTVYDDDSPWDTIPDGNGPTLSLIDPTFDNSLAASWEASSNINSTNGTPNRANKPCPIQKILIADTVCVAKPILLTLDILDDDFTYNWLISGASTSVETNDSISLSWANTGTYNIQLITKYFECTKIYNKQVVVKPCNSAPILIDDNFVVPEDNMLNNGISLLGNDQPDPEGDNLIVSNSPVIPPSNGILSLNGDGTFSYMPNPDFFGTDNFDYEVCDNGNPVICTTASVTLQVVPVNDTPIAVTDTFNIIAGAVLTGNVLQNDTDIDDNSLTANTNIISNPSNGTASIQNNGDISYQSNPSYGGTDTFDYEVCDPGGLCSTATVTVIIESSCADIQVFLYLEGAYDPALGEMHTSLSSLRKLLPGQTPASGLVTPTPAGQPYDIAPWNYMGTEGASWTDADYTGDETDWVLVSFRTGTAKSTEVGMTAGVLQKDGNIVFPDRCALNSTVVSPLYILVEHRNHIGVMTPQPIDLINNTLTFDFRSSDSYRDPTSFGQKQLPTGEWCLFAGDADQSDFPSFDIQGTDKGIWFDNNGFFDYYLSPDFNLDGDINGQDKTLWYENNGISSRVPK